MKTPLSRTSLPVLLLTLFVCASVYAQTLAFHGRVVNVVDGDTVTVLTQSNTEFQVQCRGIKAPKGQEDSAYPARQRLAALLLDEPVIVREAERATDGAVVGTIVWNGRDICLEQVTAGLALYDDESEQRRSTKQRYISAESEARSNGVGLWSSTSRVASPETNPSSPNSVADQQQQTSDSPTVNVRGYFRKDGTYVAGHKRTAPDANFNNNWSTQGNVNPYTGKVGTKKRSRWITALKWVGIGVALGALIYVDARYPSATARCNDGSLSYSQNRRGTCAHRGGVAYWLR